jgi:HlyD family secretion protein
MHSLLPNEFIKNSIDSYLFQQSAKSRRIYNLVLWSIVLILIALPFIYVDVSIQDRGIIRPVIEKAEIRASITEFVDSVYVKEGEKIIQGDTILVFRQNNPNHRINYQQRRLIDFQEHLTDLRHLAKGNKPALFSSNTRQKEYNLFLQQTNEHQTNLDKAEKDLERSRQLFERKVIAEEEYETSLHEYNKAQNALTVLKNNQIAVWQNDLNVYANSYEEMKTDMNQEIEDKSIRFIVSPVSGTLDQFNGIYKNSHVQAGSLLAVISPDSSLCAEVYVSPRNIGYIHIGMPVNLRITAFNYNEWGSISGEVLEISSDYLTDSSGDNIFYKVKCSMNQDYLIRKNGVKGNLKKGMSLSSHFIITKRSLFDLLYQKVDDWINPMQYTDN